ncbi:MAG: 23S rRNA (pseudouridine(1915)-N(3))-methyltransferase RlmH [Candidatus Saccharimonadales bacterium]
MQIVIFTVGRKLSPAAKVLHDEYTKRLSSWAEVEHRLVAPSKLAGKAAVADESKRILLALKPDDYVIVLDERGVQYANVQFANHLAKIQEYMKRTVLIIGGAAGVSQEVRDRGQMVWSLSSLVFPHELVRILVAEQLYRTFALMHDHPYHRGFM